MVQINNCLFSLLVVRICTYMYHVPLSLWFNSGVKHGSLSYICKILFNTWYIFQSSVINAGPKHTCTRVHTWRLDQSVISIFPGLRIHNGGFCSIRLLPYFISLQISSGFNVRDFPLCWGVGWAKPGSVVFSRRATRRKAMMSQLVWDRFFLYSLRARYKVYLPCLLWLCRGGWFANYSVQLEALGASLKCFIALIHNVNKSGKPLVACISNQFVIFDHMALFFDPAESCYQDGCPLPGCRIKLT